jgi:chromosome segregation ATPase
MTAPAGPPPGAPLEAYPPDAPATVEDVRATRRWTWVALAWAVAASAIAVIALITSDNNKSSNNRSSQSTADLAARIDRLDKQTTERLNAFGKRLDGKAASADVQKLDKRLTKIETDFAKSQQAETTQAADIKQLQADVKDLQTRVQKLEQNQQGTTTTP